MKKHNVSMSSRNFARKYGRKVAKKAGYIHIKNNNNEILHNEKSGDALGRLRKRPILRSSNCVRSQL